MRGLLKRRLLFSSEKTFEYFILSYFPITINLKVNREANGPDNSRIEDGGNRLLPQGRHAPKTSHFKASSSSQKLKIL